MTEQSFCILIITASQFSCREAQLLPLQEGIQVRCSTSAWGCRWEHDLEGPMRVLCGTLAMSQWGKDFFLLQLLLLVWWRPHVVKDHHTKQGIQPRKSQHIRIGVQRWEDKVSQHHHFGPWTQGANATSFGGCEVMRNCCLVPPRETQFVSFTTNILLTAELVLTNSSGRTELSSGDTDLF